MYGGCLLCPLYPLLFPSYFNFQRPPSPIKKFQVAIILDTALLILINEKKNKNHPQYYQTFIEPMTSTLLSHFLGHVAAACKRSHQWCLALTPNNTETIERMTCHCFLRPIRRDHKSSSYTTAFFD